MEDEIILIDGRYFVKHHNGKVVEFFPAIITQEEKENAEDVFPEDLDGTECNVTS